MSRRCEPVALHWPSQSSHQPGFGPPAAAGSVTARWVQCLFPSSRAHRLPRTLSAQGLAVLTSHGKRGKKLLEKQRYRRDAAVGEQGRTGKEKQKVWELSVVLSSLFSLRF